MTGRLWDLLIQLTVAATIAGVGWLIRLARLARSRERERDAKIDRLVQVFLEGTPADPFSGTPPTLSVVAQLAQIESLHTALTRLGYAVAELRESNVTAGAASAQLADDVTGLRDQLAGIRALIRSLHPGAEV